MNIVNENRKTQIDSFIDKNHVVMDALYESIESGISGEKMLSEMRKLIKIDPDFYDPYLAITDILFSVGEEREAELLLQEAYRRALLTIVDAEGRWPKEMLWEFFENHHVMRIIEEQGRFYWRVGKIDAALDIFRKLLRVNPHDNQGIRFNILAIRMNLGFSTWQGPFAVRSEGRDVYLDGFKVHMWFYENAPKYEDEFQWLFDLHKS